MLVTGGMGWQQARSYTGGWQFNSTDDDVKVLHPGPMTSFRAENQVMWAVQIPVKGPLKLVSWNSLWTSFNGS